MTATPSLFRPTLWRQLALFGLALLVALSVAPLVPALAGVTRAQCRPALALPTLSPSCLRSPPRSRARRFV